MGSEATTRNDAGRVPLQLTTFVGRKDELAEHPRAARKVTATAPRSPGRLSNRAAAAPHP
jgi:hypothetical protein